MPIGKYEAISDIHLLLKRRAGQVSLLFCDISKIFVMHNRSIANEKIAIALQRLLLKPRRIVELNSFPPSSIQLNSDFIAPQPSPQPHPIEQNKGRFVNVAGRFRFVPSRSRNSWLLCRVGCRVRECESDRRMGKSIGANR
jgi:hypothetical protein